MSKEYIRYGLNIIEKDIGLEICQIKNRHGNLIDSIRFKKLHIFNSSGNLRIAKMPWEETFPEEFMMEKLFIQGGEHGIVISDNSYITAFIEVFPKYIPDGDKKFSSFIRGEGKTFEEAETNAFLKTKQIFNCKSHQWDREGRTTGAAFCKLCNAFNSKALEPTTECSVCKVKTRDFTNKGKHYCSRDYYLINSNEIDKGLITKAHKNFFKDTSINNRIFNLLQNYDLSLLTNKQKKNLYTTLYQSLKEGKQQLYSKWDFPHIYHYITKLFIIRKVTINDNLLNKLYSDYINIYYPRYDRNKTSKQILEFFLNQDPLF